jgi:murein L,D-transpeptidase YcbB/YkuD
VAHIPNGPSLKKGMTDPRVPALRERLGVHGAANNVYDQELSDAVKAFQKQKGLAVNGVLAQSTVNALNGRSRGGDIDAVISNMERWRWLPRDLGKAHVIVNVPDFTLKVVHNDAVTFRTKIVVGKPGMPSPSFSAKIETIQVNPTWHVPQSIIYNEYLPALQQDPTVLSRMGLVMERTADGSIAIRQPPGERNALGRIKFNFPNRFQVYLHDTPDKNLFSHDRRAYSHGCMRVQNPTQFGEALAAIAMPQERYTAQRLASMFGTGEQWLKFKTAIPVHLLYMNAYVDDAGKLVVREDIYGYDGRVRAALRGDSLPQIAEKSQVVRPERSAGVRVRGGGRRVVQDQPQRGWFPFFFQ